MVVVWGAVWFKSGRLVVRRMVGDRLLVGPSCGDDAVIHCCFLKKYSCINPSIKMRKLIRIIRSMGHVKKSPPAGGGAGEGTIHSGSEGIQGK